MEPHQIKRIIEAALLAASHPLTLPQISGLFDELEMPPQEELAKALEALQADCAGRGIELVEVASGFRYQVCQDVHPFVSRLWAERQSRYSRALLETLSLIAYRQPITRAEIEQIRGVAVSTNIIRTLEERDWVRVVGYRDLPGKPALFGTTKQFLDYFNLKSLDQLPPLSEIRDLEEMDPQLALDGGERGIPAAISAEIDEAAQEIEEAEAGIDDAAETADGAAEASATAEAADIDPEIVAEAASDSIDPSSAAPAEPTVGTDADDAADAHSPSREAPEPGDAEASTTEPVA
jgi:segregation and condensation protein B